jgi:hypothetical protein
MTMIYTTRRKITKYTRSPSKMELGTASKADPQKAYRKVFALVAKFSALGGFSCYTVIVLFLEANIHGMEGAIGIARAYAKSQGIHVANETGSTPIRHVKSMHFK